MAGFTAKITVSSVPPEGLGQYSNVVETTVFWNLSDTQMQKRVDVKACNFQVYNFPWNKLFSHLNSRENTRRVSLTNHSPCCTQRSSDHLSPPPGPVNFQCTVIWSDYRCKQEVSFWPGLLTHYERWDRSQQSACWIQHCSLFCSLVLFVQERYKHTFVPVIQHHSVLSVSLQNLRATSDSWPD